MKTYSNLNNRYNNAIVKNYKDKDLKYEYNKVNQNVNNMRKYNKMTYSNSTSRNKNNNMKFIKNQQEFHNNNTQEYINRNKEDDKINILNKYQINLDKYQNLK